MIADIMTEMLPRPRFLELREKLNVISRSNFNKQQTGPVAKHVRILIAIEAEARTIKRPIKEAVEILKESLISIGDLS
jgi:hypothetical protein